MARSLVDDADDTLEIRPQRCRRCDASLEGAKECRRQRRQVVDVRPPPGPEVVARAALPTCAHYLPVGSARDLLETLTAIDVSRRRCGSSHETVYRQTDAPTAQARGARAGDLDRADAELSDDEHGMLPYPPFGPRD